MLPPTMPTSASPTVLSTASPCGGGGLSTFGMTENSSEAQSLEDESMEIANDIWAYMGPVIFFVGLIGNILILVVMCSRRMRGTSTSDYLIIMAVADLLTLITGMIPEWLQAVNIFVLQTWNPPMCKIYKFVSYATGDTATWIRVLFTLDRFMAICFPMKKTDCCLSWRAKYYCLGAAFAAVAKNLHTIWTRGAQYHTQTVYELVDCVLVPTNVTNTTLLSNCGYPTPAYEYFELYVRPWIVFALINVLPFCVILICNIFIIRAMIRMTRMHKEQHLSAKGGDWQLFQTTAMCLGASFAFLFCVTPTMVILIGKPYWTAVGTNMAYDISKSVSNQLLYLNNSVNFFLYCITGKKFRETLSLLLRCRCRELICKSDNSASRARHGSVTVAGINGIRRESNVRQISRIDSFVRQNSAQSVGVDLRSLGERTISGRIEEQVEVTITDGITVAMPVELEEGVVTEDVVMTQLAETVGGTRKRRDGTSIHNRSGSESSSGVSSSTSNGDQTPLALSPIDDAAENGSCSSPTNHSLEDDLRSLETNSAANKELTVKDQKLTHALTSDFDLTTTDPCLEQDLNLATNRCLEITQYSKADNPDGTNSSVTGRTNSSANDSTKSHSSDSKSNLTNRKNIPNVSSLGTDNSESRIPEEIESDGKTSQKSWEGQNTDLDKITTNNIDATSLNNSHCCDATSDGESARGGNLDQNTQSENKEPTVNRTAFHGSESLENQRKSMKDELLNKLPESIC